MNGSTVVASGYVGIGTYGSLGTFLIEDSHVTAVGTGNVSIYNYNDIVINSGTVVALEGIAAGGAVAIDGGSVVAGSGDIDPAPVNGDDDAVALTKIVLSGAGGNALVTKFDEINIPSYYGLEAVYTQNDESINLWLPAGVTITSLVADGVTYVGTVEVGGTATFTTVKAEPIPTPTPAPVSTPSPKTGDDAPRILFFLTAAGSALFLLGKRKKTNS